MKRSQQRHFTKKAKILRYMRLSRGITQARAALLCDCSEAAIGHYENGRMDVSADRLSTFLRGYGYAREEFEALLGGPTPPVLRLKEECTRLISLLDDSKLRIVQALLETLVGPN